VIPQKTQSRRRGRERHEAIPPRSSCRQDQGESVVVEKSFAELWTLKTLPSTQFTTWRVLCNAIASKDNVLRCGIPLVCVRCPLCGVEEESVRHLFFEWKVSWRIWGLCLEWLRSSLVLHCDAQMHFKMFKPIGLKHAIIKCWGGGAYG